MNNIERCRQVISWLEQWGCHEAVVCAGARNAPLVMALHQLNGLKVWSFFEERSAAFFALGRMKTLGQPVAVVTTSGTAAAELLPATIEAHYSGLPLLLITADRPPQYRGRGAPQAIEQVGLFSHYVEKSLDYSGEAKLISVEWSRGRPLHLNVCLSEPTRDQLNELSRPGEKNFKPQAAAVPTDVAFSAASAAEIALQFCKQSQRPLVVVGPLREESAGPVEQWLKATRYPVYLESLSGLCHSRLLQEQKVRGSERVLRQAFGHGWVDGVIRLGGVPTTRLWRDLETDLRMIPVISFNDQKFSGLSRDGATILPLRALEQWPASAVARPVEPLWLTLQSKAQNQLQQLLVEHPSSEPGMIHQLAQQIPDFAKIYLGNSLPVREWDLAVNDSKKWQMAASRGANGIDGQLSTFLGFAESAKSNWCVVGDLTALYDLSAPWVLNQCDLADLNLIVINNGGGKIFQRMYGKNELENHHNLQFSQWAKMWGLNYLRLEQVTKLSFDLKVPRLIELVPDETQTQKFWSSWDEFWNNR